MTDAKGKVSTATGTTVTVQNLPPAVSAGADQVLAGSSVTLRPTFTDPGANDFPWSYSIVWGDGAQQTGTTNSMTTPITGSHSYAPGSYTARVTVTDKDGAAGTDEVKIAVMDPNGVEVFAGAGNISTCGNDWDEATARILDTLPGHVFTLGDAVNPNGTSANYTNCYGPTWGRHKARTVPVPGNHDYDVVGAADYFSYFGAAAGDPAKGYYSFDLGSWHIVVLNNANSATVPYGTGSAQELWLKADLAANTKQCTLAMLHFPAFFSSSDPAWHSSTDVVVPLWVDLYRANVDVVVTGQQYFYERFAPLDESGGPDAVRGVREFSVGTGGYAPSMPSSVAPHSEALSADVGVLKLTLGQGSYLWQFIPAAGMSFTDSGSGSCH